MESVPHREIAKALNVTRQHVSSLVKRGLPTSSLEAAEAWYRSRISHRYSKGRQLRRPDPFHVPIALPDDWTDLPLDLQPCSFGIEPTHRIPRPIKLVELDHLKPVLTDEEVDAWMDQKVETVEDSIRLSAFFIQLIRLHIDWMPHVMAERVNPLDPEHARRELQHWVDTMDRECFTDGEQTHAGGK